MSNANPSPFNYRDGDAEPEWKARVYVANQEIRVPWDYWEWSYIGGLPTVQTFRNGGPAGSVVATKTLTYSGTDVVSCYITYP